MFPNFLCIGAPKAGTSWLYHNIKQHPAVWMPPYKELRYFNDPSKKPLILRFFGERNCRWRTLAKQEFLSAITLKDPQRLKWFLRYFILPRHDKWYLSLFSQAKGHITGDITPAYSRLKKSQVFKIHELIPNLKIIHILRNPIQRLWSQISQHVNTHLHQNIENVGDRKILEFLQSDFLYRGSEYIKTLEIWENFYPRDQLFIGFFDKLVRDPGAFLKEIYDFLELDSSDRYIPIDVHINPSPGSYPTIPREFARLLANKLNNQIERLHLRISNNYTKNWLDYEKHYL